MMPMRSQSAAASSIEWVVRTTVLASLARATLRHSSRRDAGSSPVLGSSR